MSRQAQNPNRSLSRPAALLPVSAALSLCATAASAARLAVGPGGGNCTYSTIQAAIDAAASGDTIAVADTGSAYNEKLTITDKSLTISSCPCYNPVCLYDTTHNTLTSVTISGAGGANAPVLKIATTNVDNPISVSLDRITIQDGHSGSIDGGGISFDGVGSLTLTRTNVTSNTANYGAGINFKGEGGSMKPHDLYLKHDTFVTYNTASVSGGGIRLDGDQASLHVTDPNVWVSNNEATTGYGGGLQLVNFAYAAVGSAGYLFSPVFFENTAAYGGGIAVNKGSAFLYTTDPMHPGGVDSNTATRTGGGIYVGAEGFFCGLDSRITNNIAQEGTGVYVDTYNDTGGYAELGAEDGTCQRASLGGVACDPSQSCNAVRGNVARDVANGNTPTAGAAMLVQTAAHLVADKIDVRGNQGGYALRALGDPSSGTFFTEVKLSNCLFADNTVSADLILASDGYSHVSAQNCTFAHNSIGGARVIAANDVLALDDNIIDSPLPALVFSGPAANREDSYNLAGNTSGLTTGTTNTQGQATFVDVNNGDYRLFYGYRGGALVKSLGIDYAPPVSGDDRDIRGQPHDQSVSQPFFGDRDLGAFEMQGVADRIFIATFGDDVLLVQ